MYPSFCCHIAEHIQFYNSSIQRKNMKYSHKRENQSTIVRLKDCNTPTNLKLRKISFYNISIKRLVKKLIERLDLTFQFYNSSIKSPELIIIKALSRYFNSNIVRLKWSSEIEKALTAFSILQ
jgi:hypothetical protein